MRCPQCGADIPDGSWYCEKCGEDIHIVPDFEPEVELNMEQTINGIAEDIKEERKGYQKPPTQSKAVGNRLEVVKQIVASIFVGLLCLMVVIVFLTFYRNNSPVSMMDTAQRAVGEEQYDEAIEAYKRAMEISEDKVSVMFNLAEVYFLKNNKMEYEYWLREIVQSKEATSEQIESAYGKLIAIYRARQDFNSINELLLNSGNERVISTYQDYVAQVPEFTIEEGYYSEIQPLKLSAYGTGKIYYTLDGSLPDENSPVYTAPIILDNGDHIVCAYFVNAYGIASEYVTKTYHIQIEELPPPMVETVSGEYQFPGYIEVRAENQEIYYTTDGSEPTISSPMYTKPIPMPLGKTTYKFIRIEDGRSSSVVERTINLVMNTAYTPGEAEQDVIQYAIQSIRIYDEEGHASGLAGTYKYRYQYVTNINQVDDFYVISEILEGDDGTSTKTGNHYAVNAYTGYIYKLQIDENYNYTLVEIEQQPE